MNNVMGLNTTNPVFNRNRMKLGTFAMNAEGGTAVTTIDGTWRASWDNNLRVAQLADRVGFEAIVPIARWKGFGGQKNFNGESLETHAWAAGLAASTRYPAVFSTSHVPTIHPVFLAKQSATIDQISGGRYALNVVCGWFPSEMEMFTPSMMDHDTAYEYAAEWLDIIQRLWTSDEAFDHEGKFFTIKKAFQLPKPLQKPHPPIMQAGNSAVGQRFAAKYADLAFTSLRRVKAVGRDPENAEQMRQQIDNLRRLARDEFDRDLQVWTQGYVVCRPTEQEALDFLHYYVVENGDKEAINNLMTTLGMKTQSFDAEFLRAFYFHYAAGWGGYPLVGTPEQIVDELERLADAGLNGILLNWINYEDGLRQWISHVLPLMEQAGLRERVAVPQ